MDKNLNDNKDNDKSEEIFIYGKKGNNKNSNCNFKEIIVFILLALISIFFIFIYLNHKFNFEEYISNTPIPNSQRRCIMLGYGFVGKNTFPYLVKMFNFKEYIIIDKIKIEKNEFNDFKNIKIKILQKNFTEDDIEKSLYNLVQDKDVIINLYDMMPTMSIIKSLLQNRNMIYIDAALEGKNILIQSETYASFFKFQKKIKNKITGTIDAGANPGLISHFSRLALVHMAESAVKRNVTDSKEIKSLLDKKDLPSLVKQLKVNTVHISEYDTTMSKKASEYTNTKSSTWCVDSFVQEWTYPADFPVGTHDYEYFKKNNYTFYNGPPMSAMKNESCYLKTVSPYGIFTGKVIRHGETIDISKIFNSKEHNITCVFVYRPSKITRKNIDLQNFNKFVIKNIDEETGGPLIGNETLGVTLISERKDIPIRWYGSVLTSEESRKLGGKLNPTSLQVTAGILSHLSLLIENPKMGFCNPSDFDSEKIMKIAKPLLGIIVDEDLPYNLPTQWDKLISTKELLNNDF